jgi:hypothetical protein
MATDIDIDEIYRQVTAKLRETFPQVPADEVDSVELDELADRPVRDYIQVLTERAVKKRLAARVPQAA